MLGYVGMSALWRATPIGYLKPSAQNGAENIVVVMGFWLRLASS